MLQNHVYRGQISHKGAVYPGEHPAIIDQALWAAVQTQLAERRIARPDRPNGTAPSLLTGLMHDAAGDRLVPSHAVKAGKRYRYYVSSRLITGSRSDDPGGIRVPSAELEKGVIERIGQFLADRSALFEALQPIEPDLHRLQQQTARAAEIAGDLSHAGRIELAAMLRTLVARISVREDRLEIAVAPTALLALLRGTAPPELSTAACSADREEPVPLSKPVALRRAGKEMRSGGMARQRSVSSNGCCTACGTNRGA